MSSARTPREDLDTNRHEIDEGRRTSAKVDNDHETGELPSRIVYSITAHG